MPALPGGMADLAALLLLLATGWWDRTLRRMGVRRTSALAVGALVLAAAWVNVGFGAAVPVRLNLGGVLPAAAMLVAAWVLPRGGGSLAAASAAGACLLFGLHGWTGPLAAVGRPLVAAVAVMVVAGVCPLSLLAVAATPALAGIADWALAYAQGLPGTVWIGGGASFATMVIGVAAVALALAARDLPVAARVRTVYGARRLR